jgi:hypothetical protein
MIQKCVAFVIMLIFTLIAGCTRGGKPYTTPSTQPGSSMATVENALPATHWPAETSTLVPLSPTPASTSTEDNEVEATSVTITGTVQDVMLSARIILLQEPVQGFSTLALTQDTKLVSAEGLDITLQEVRAGMRVQATGRPGTPGTLLPEEVRILP